MAVEDEWNLNDKYLLLIMEFICKFNEAKLNDDYQGMYKSLDCFESILSPKTDNDDVEKNLEIIERDVYKMQVYNEAGKLICYYPDLIHPTVKLMNKTYKLLLIKLEASGMLTRIQRDPRTVMGRFGGS